MFTVRQLGVVVLAISLVACSASTDPAPQAGEAPAEPALEQTAPAAEATMAEAPPATGRNLEEVNLCELIPNDQVAELFGAEPTRGDLEGVTGPTCFYQITPDGGSTVQNLYVTLVGADLAEVSLTLARDEGAQQVPGLGNESLIQYVDSEQQFHLSGVRRGNFGFEITAPDDEGAIRLAELILERVAP